MRGKPPARSEIMLVFYHKCTEMRSNTHHSSEVRDQVQTVSCPLDASTLCPCMITTTFFLLNPLNLGSSHNLSHDCITHTQTGLLAFIAIMVVHVWGAVGHIQGASVCREAVSCVTPLLLCSAHIHKSLKSCCKHKSANQPAHVHTTRG